MSARPNSSPTPGDNWRTPRYVFDWLARRYAFEVDLAASRENALCAAWLTPADDALGVDWHAHWLVGWCNPPYSDPAPWLAKAREEACSGFTTVLLVPTPNGERHFGAHVFDVATEVIFITGRLAFLGADGEPVAGNRAGSVVAIYEAHNLGHTRYRHIFRDQIPGAPVQLRRGRRCS